MDEHWPRQSRLHANHDQRGIAWSSIYIQSMLGLTMCSRVLLGKLEAAALMMPWATAQVDTCASDALQGQCVADLATNTCRAWLVAHDFMIKICLNE
jgi:hypothetical protein